VFGFERCRLLFQLLRSFLLLFFAAFAFFAFTSFAIRLQGLLEVFEDLLVGDSRRNLDLLYMLGVSGETISYFLKT